MKKRRVVSGLFCKSLRGLGLKSFLAFLATQLLKFCPFSFLGVVVGDGGGGGVGLGVGGGGLSFLYPRFALYT